MDQIILVTWKSILIFIMLIVLTRLIGRKLLSQMSFFEYVVGITIGTITGSYVVQAVKDMWVLISPVILALCTIAFSFLNMKSITVRKLTKGEPVVVIQNGRILEKNLLKLRYNLGDLEMQLREKDVFNFEEVEFAVLEPHGQLSVLKKSQNQPVTPGDLNINTEYKGLSIELVKDGKVFIQNLKQNNLTEDWLKQELAKKGAANYSEVMYAALNTDGSIYVDKKADPLKYEQRIED